MCLIEFDFPSRRARVLFHHDQFSSRGFKTQHKAIKAGGGKRRRPRSLALDRGGRDRKADDDIQLGTLQMLNVSVSRPSNA